jgi:predicted Zn-ribbon and HTH transcriptional regulator
MTGCECVKCGYKWSSKKEKPKSCPACKSYRWEVK